MTNGTKTLRVTVEITAPGYGIMVDSNDVYEGSEYERFVAHIESEPSAKIIGVRELTWTEQLAEMEDTPWAF